MNSSGNQFTSINVEPDSNRKFSRISQNIGSDIQKISQNVSSMKRMVNLVGTAQDSHELRQQLQKIQQYTQQLVKDTNNSLNTLNSIPLSSEERQFRMQRERLTDEYTAALNMFQATQREALKKESRQVQLKRASVHSNSVAIPPPPSNDPFRDDLHANQLIELQDDRGSKTQTYDYQTENERNNLQQLAEQEEAIRNLERDINDVNEIYKSLGRLVHDQGETIDSIEANIERAHINVRQGTSELRKASNYMTQARKKKFYLIAILAFILLVIFLLWKYS
ncbi:syntaxin-7-like [Planococcus citri]|uniref:syntaxin-7-like n=1 Tax=Planococcus citri TaxID=170843 RepID=UPI0031F9EABD